jgi:hypothetical protein
MDKFYVISYEVPRIVRQDRVVIAQAQGFKINH